MEEVVIYVFRVIRRTCMLASNSLTVEFRDTVARIKSNKKRIQERLFAIVSAKNKIKDILPINIHSFRREGIVRQDAL